MVAELKKNMQQAVDAYKQEMSSLRTGRAHPGLLNKITVDYYGSMTPLSQMANVSVTDPRTLSIAPWDRQAINVIMKAIQISDLGLNPVLAGETIKVSIPPLTEERRKELVRHLKAEAEKAKVGIRNIRRSAMNDVKEEVKEKLISEDDERKVSQDIQKVTDEMINMIDQLTQEKEKELMTV